MGKETNLCLEDYAVFSRFKWTAEKSVSSKTIYAIRHTYTGGKQTVFRLHREILNTPKHLKTDHIDGNGLNNCRCNLRVANQMQSVQNQGIREDSSSGVRGVNWHKGYKKWLARVQHNNCRIVVGLFDSIDEAAQAVSDARIMYHGDFSMEKSRS